MLYGCQWMIYHVIAILYGSHTPSSSPVRISTITFLEILNVISTFYGNCKHSTLLSYKNLKRSINVLLGLNALPSCYQEVPKMISICHHVLTVASSHLVSDYWHTIVANEWVHYVKPLGDIRH